MKRPNGSPRIYLALVLSLAAPLGVAACSENAGVDDTTAANAAAAAGAPPTAFRVTQMELRDPHIYFDLTCGDITTVANSLLGQGLSQDMTPPLDHSADINVLTVFRPLAPARASVPLDVDLGATCVVPALSSCRSTGENIVASTASNHATGTCLAPLAGTTFSGYTPAIAGPSGPCFASDAESFDVNLGTVAVHLDDARIGGRYVGTPATKLDEGLIVGFISVAKARTTIFPASLPLVGGKTLAQLLLGGDNRCSRPGGGTDLDTGPDGTTRGWYFYLSYSANQLPYIPAVQMP